MESESSSVYSVGHALEVYREVMGACDDPAAANLATLRRILADGADTEFGRAHGFSEIDSIEDFRRALPITAFDEYADLVYRQIMNGEKGLMTTYETVAYNKTSGTTGNIKKIPMSSVSLDDLLDLTCSYVKGVALSRIDGYDGGGRSIWLTEATSCSVLEDGNLCTGLSGHLTLKWHIPQGDRFTSPVEASKPSPGTNTRYLHARFGIAEPDVRDIACTFASFVLDMFRYIEKNWPMLCDDIERGTIDPSVRIPDAERARLESVLVPMPERAAELRRIFSEGFDGVARRIWPGLAYINTVCTGVFSAYTDAMRRYIGDVPIVPFGLTASEGVVTVATDVDRTDSIPVPTRMFYEFRPLDSEDTVDICDLEEGVPYEVVITTSSGLYRYGTRDVVQVHGRIGRMPTLDYMYRIDMCANLNGEKTYEPALRKAMDATAKELGFEYLDFCVYANTEAQPPHYEFYIEKTKFPDGLTMEELADCLEKNLAIANPVLNHPVYRDMCGHLTARILQDETYQFYHDKMVMRGGSSTQVKPVKIIFNDAQLRFFRILVDRDYE